MRNGYFFCCWNGEKNVIRCGFFRLIILQILSSAHGSLIRHLPADLHRQCRNGISWRKTNSINFNSFRPTDIQKLISWPESSTWRWFTLSSHHQGRWRLNVIIYEQNLKVIDAIMAAAIEWKRAQGRNWLGFRFLPAAPRLTWRTGLWAVIHLPIPAVLQFRWKWGQVCRGVSFVIDG